MLTPCCEGAGAARWTNYDKVMIIAPNIYAANAGAPGALDRCDAHRRDPDWIAKRAQAADARLLVMRDGDHPLDADHAPLAIGGADAIPMEDLIFLGVDADGAWFGCEAASADQDALSAAANWAPLRRVGADLPWRAAHRLATLRAVMLWRRRFTFCPSSGAPLTSIRGGFAKRCEADGVEYFPTIAPAVIMLPFLPSPDGDLLADRCLLAHGAHLPHGMYSTIAGFVEPGESLEDAVIRETQEELGLYVRRPIYLHSQPWPFPNSLMVGFLAEIAPGPLTLAEDEIEDARWFSRAELLSDALEDQADFRLPRPDSIARRIIRDWAAAATV